MQGSNSRLTTILLSMFLGMSVLAIICYATIFVQPDIPFNPLSPQRATIEAEALVAVQPGTAATPTPEYP